MTSAPRAFKALDDRVDQAKRTLRPWVAPAARFGYVTKGLVYLGVGLLALRAALTAARPGASAQASAEPSKHSVFLLILAQPFGRILLTALAAGLIAYALWKLIEALFNPEGEPRNFKGYGKRLAHLGGALVYGALGVGAAAMAAGLRSGNPDALRDWTRWGMSKPFGRTIIALVGAGVVARGAQQLWQAWRSDLPDQLQLYRMNHTPRQWAVRVGRIGLAARGAVFLLVGEFLALSSWHANPDRARGIGQALLSLERNPHGPWLLAAVALGLIAYGLFSLIEARYRLIRPPT